VEPAKERGEKKSEEMWDFANRGEGTVGYIYGKSPVAAEDI